ncbi:MAG: hypothetical protein IPM51_17265 [Sphingobacteriaceae bacterium]|nr:hypothetical protein [Sphingobacteriaceae bacterium]
MSIPYTINAQVPPTFTCNNIQVNNTLTAMGSMETQSMTVNSTLTVMDDVSAQQDLKVEGSLYANGPAIFAGAVQIATLAGSGISQILSDNSGNLFKGPALPPTWPCIPAGLFWSLGGNNINALNNTIYQGMSDIGTCDQFDFILKANNINRQWIKPDGKIGFGIQNPGSTNGPEYQFHQGVARLSGMNTFGGPQIIFDGGAPSTNGDWGIEYLPISNTSVPGLNFWKPSGSFNSYNYLLFISDSGKVSVGAVTESSSAKFNVDGWNGDAERVKVNANRKAYSVMNKNTNQQNFVVYGNGKTRIGIKEPLPAGPHGDAMLAVDGKILAKEIFVNIHNSVWPDYVFNKDYHLMPLSEVKNNILEEKHLPGIPSAKEIEEIGISLGEMQRIQMEKIENLYLYIINQQHEIDELRTELNELKLGIKKNSNNSK